ncbi:MAG: hypothetical protein Q9178_007067 [Gyalolechia marmorata]
MLATSLLSFTSSDGSTKVYQPATSFSSAARARGAKSAYISIRNTPKENHFLPEFNYFSLGLILLEIGIWSSLLSMAAGRKLANLEEQRQHLLLKYTPLLGHHVGREYAAAVKVCLEHSGSVESDESVSETTVSKFSEEVVERLRALSAGAS